MATQKQLDYAALLIKQHTTSGTLGKAIRELRPEWSEEDDFAGWLYGLSTEEMGRVIYTLKKTLYPRRDYTFLSPLFR